MKFNISFIKSLRPWSQHLLFALNNPARQTSWRDGDLGDDRVGGPQDRGGRGWHEGSRGLPPRRSWDDDNLPEWATENLAEGGGTFDATGAFHGSDDEQVF